MDQLARIWTALSVRRRIIVLVATMGMFAAVLGLTRMATAPNMVLLYSALDGSSAGEVVSALEQRGIAYEVRGGSILVDAPERDALRMTLAAEGLPRNSSQGYELLDSLTGFGTTSQMFDAAYWRAKEGELARTIAASPNIDSARVHIARDVGTPFRRNSRTTASIFVTSSAGAISPGHAKALRFLVASAVAGLAPDDVAIVDSAGDLVGSQEDEGSAGGSDERAEILREKVMRLLEARVGYGNVVVEVSVDTETESESIRERRVDPADRVAISTETQERTTSARNAGRGDVTVASNLPDGAKGGAGDSSSQDSETRERVNYEVSQIDRELIRAPGSIRRITVAALVDGVLVANTDGQATFEARSDEELSQLRDLIAAAVGVDEDRGDTITIRSMQFNRVADGGTAPGTGFLRDLPLEPMRLIQVLTLATVALLLGLFVVRPVLMKSTAEPPKLAAPDPVNGALNGQIEESDLTLPHLPVISAFEPGTADFGSGVDGEKPAERLRALIGDRHEETVEILRSWLDSEEMA